MSLRGAGVDDDPLDDATDWTWISWTDVPVPSQELLENAIQPLRWNYGGKLGLLQSILGVERHLPPAGLHIDAPSLTQRYDLEVRSDAILPRFFGGVTCVSVAQRVLLPTTVISHVRPSSTHSGSRARDIGLDLFLTHAPRTQDAHHRTDVYLGVRLRDPAVPAPMRRILAHTLLRTQLSLEMHELGMRQDRALDMNGPYDAFPMYVREAWTRLAFH